MKYCLSPQEIPRALAIFHRIPLLSSQYSYNKELLQNSENELVEAKIDLELAKISLKMTKDSAKAQQLELTTTKESLKKLRMIMKLKENQIGSAEETINTKEVSEKVECSTQTDTNAEKNTRHLI